MARFRGTTSAQLSRSSGFDAYGQETWGLALTLKVTLIEYKPAAVPSAVSVTHTASHSKVRELQIVGTALIGPLVAPQMGDRLVVLNNVHRLCSIAPVVGFSGQVSHYACGLEAII